MLVPVTYGTLNHYLQQGDKMKIEKRVRVNPVAYEKLKAISSKRKEEGAAINKQCDILADLIGKEHKKEFK